MSLTVNTHLISMSCRRSLATKLASVQSLLLMMDDSPNERWSVLALEKELPRTASSMPLQAALPRLICEGLTLAVRFRYPRQSLAPAHCLMIWTSIPLVFYIFDYLIILYPQLTCPHVLETS